MAAVALLHNSVECISKGPDPEPTHGRKQCPESAVAAANLQNAHAAHRTMRRIEMDRQHAELNPEQHTGTLIHDLPRICSIHNACNIIMCADPTSNNPSKEPLPIHSALAAAHEVGNLPVPLRCDLNRPRSWVFVEHWHAQRPKPTCYLLHHAWRDAFVVAVQSGQLEQPTCLLHSEHFNACKLARFMLPLMVRLQATHEPDGSHVS